jgi:hypothetical protein
MTASYNTTLTKPVSRGVKRGPPSFLNSTALLSTARPCTEFRVARCSGCRDTLAVCPLRERSPDRFSLPVASPLWRACVLGH